MIYELIGFGVGIAIGAITEYFYITYKAKKILEVIQRNLNNKPSI
jgi:hypothetical protein